MPINSFIEYLQFEKKYSKHTTTAYLNDINSFQKFCDLEYDKQSIVEIDYVQIRTWIVSLVNTGVSNRTVNRKVSSLKSFYKFLQKIKTIENNPLARIHSIYKGNN